LIYSAYPGSGVAVGVGTEVAVVLTQPSPWSMTMEYVPPEAVVSASSVPSYQADMDVPSATLILPTKTWGGTLCAGADMDQEVICPEGKLVVEAVRLSSLAPPCTHAMLSFAHTFPILNLIVFPSHSCEVDALLGIGVGTGVAMGNGRGVGVGTEVAVGTTVGVFVGAVQAYPLVWVEEL